MQSVSSRIWICVAVSISYNNNHYTTSILSITWQKHISNTKVLTQASLPSIYTILMQSQLRWAGHVVCMKDHHLPKKLLYGELSQGKYSQGGQKNSFKDTLKVFMKSFGIASNCQEYLVQDREKWREVVKYKTKVRRNAATEQCRKLRKGTVTSANGATIPCSHSPRLFPHTGWSH